MVPFPSLFSVSTISGFVIASAAESVGAATARSMGLGSAFAAAAFGTGAPLSSATAF